MSTLRPKFEKTLRSPADQGPWRARSLVRVARLGFLGRALLCVAALAQGALAGASDLPEAVTTALAQAGLDTQAMAVLVEPAVGPGPRLAHQAQRLMQPGSTMKLVTSVVALDRLGPQHRGRTTVLAAAALEGDVLQGDLVLKGGADPEFGQAQLWALLQQLRHQGIREIAGDLLLDRTLFKPARMDIGVPAFDASPEFEYNVIPDALHFNASLLPLELSSDRSRLRAAAMPTLPGLQIDTHAMVLSSQPCRDWGELWQLPTTTPTAQGGMQVQLAGQFPRDCVRQVGLQLVDRNWLTGAMFRQAWEGLGGVWRGQVREAAAPAGARVLAQRVSRPWGEMLQHMNKTSDNARTRLLYLSLGAQRKGAANARATTLEQARTEVLAWFARKGIPSKGLVLDNGSGLSRSERISAEQMVAMLKVARRSRWAPELLASLPVAGVDGTMRARLTDSPAAGLARLKTGTLGNVRALAGYVPDEAGRWWVVSATLNHERAGAARPALDALIDWVARGGMASWLQPPAVGPKGEGP